MAHRKCGSREETIRLLIPVFLSCLQIKERRREKAKISELKPPDSSSQAAYRLRRVFYKSEQAHAAAPPFQTAPPASCLKPLTFLRFYAIFPSARSEGALFYGSNSRIRRRLKCLSLIRLFSPRRNQLWIF